MSERESTSQVNTIAVIGAGTMGGGIAALCLMNGFQVRLYDPSPPSLEKAKARCLKRTDAATVSANLRITGDLVEAAEGADYVIEAVPEKLELKRDLFTQLDELTPPHAVLATNTSELSVTAIAGVTKRPPPGYRDALVQPARTDGPH